VVLISQNDTIIYSKAKGYSDFENKTELEASDLFVIGSISKQITAVLVLKEMENGALKLDDPIQKFLPELKQSWAKEVTIHHLLTHTHGIIDINIPLAFQPGSTFQYSQLGYQLLANILEHTQKKSFKEISMEFFK